MATHQGAVLSALTTKEKMTLRNLREKGCAVTVFQPHELGEATARAVEERMCAAGANEIQANGNLNDSNDDEQE